MSNPYDDLAPEYDKWITGDPACVPTVKFYLGWLAQAVGRIVEGGVGTGRIAIELARRNQLVTGIDISAPMLSIARDRARLLGPECTLSLCQMDLLLLGLRSVDFFILPCRTIGHFVSHDERLQVVNQIFGSLAPGCRFDFDHYVPDLAWARENHCRPLRMFTEEAGAVRLEIWDTYEFDFARSLLNCAVDVVRNRRSSEASELHEPSRRTVAFTFSWLAPDEVRELAAVTGFDVEAHYGDFNEGPFNAQSEQQIWGLRRPLGRGPGLRRL